MKNKDLKPSQRILVFDHTLFVDDVTTALSVTMKTAFIRRRYEESMVNGRELIDVVFDHRPQQVSRGHFTSFLREEDLL